MSLSFVVQKELKKCFSSPGIWLLTSVFWLVTGFYLAEVLLGFQGVVAQIEAVIEEQGGALPGSLDLATVLFGGLFDLLGSLCWWILALISFGLDWQGKHQTANYSRLQAALTHSLLIWGKLLARVVYFLFMLFPLIVYEMIILSAIAPPIKVIIPLLANVSLILLVAVILSFHIAIAVCLSQRWLGILASCGLFSLFWLLDWLSDRAQGMTALLLEHFSLFTGYHDLVRGILPVGSVVMMLSYILGAVFFASQVLKLSSLSR